MQLHCTKPVKVMKLAFEVDRYGKEKKSISDVFEIQAVIHEHMSGLKEELRGSEIKKQITLFSNELISEDNYIEYKDNYYKILSINSTTVIEPIHHTYTLEMV